MKNTVKKYWIEIMLIIGYLLADNLHMIVNYFDYSPGWYVPYNPKYKFHDSVYYTLHYGFNISFFVAIVLFITSPKELNKVWLRFALLIVTFFDFIAEIFETFNLYIPQFGNYGYNEGAIVQILILIFALIIAFKMKKLCMKLLKYLSSG